MNIVNFTPIPALIGGMIIGLASAIMMAFNGRIFGISGIIGGILNPLKGDMLWRFIVLGGLICGAFLAQLALHTPAAMVTRSPLYLVIGGFLVGFGARLGSGCTSGHGVCGISRFSVRSISATMTFMATGFITVFIMKALGLN